METRLEELLWRGWRITMFSLAQKMVYFYNFTHALLIRLLQDLKLLVLVYHTYNVMLSAELLSLHLHITGLTRPPTTAPWRSPNMSSTSLTLSCAKHVLRHQRRRPGRDLGPLRG